MQEPFSDDQALLFLTRPRMVHVFCEHLSPVDESACNPKPKSVRQTGRYPFNAEHNDLANDTSALRVVRERNRRRKKRSPSASRSVIKLSRESSERFALGKNRDMGIRSARLRSVFCQAGLAPWVF